MGSGKSRWGRWLAGALGCASLDLDQLLEEQAGMSVAEMFAQQGEIAFRERERAALLGLREYPPAVVSLGGGTPCFFDNILQINTLGTSIYLDVPIEVLCQRLQKSAGKRPLLAGLDADGLRDFVEKTLAQRLPYYQQAQHTVHWTGDEEAFGKTMFLIMNDEL